MNVHFGVMKANVHLKTAVLINAPRYCTTFFILRKVVVAAAVFKFSKG